MGYEFDPWKPVGRTLLEMHDSEQIERDIEKVDRWLAPQEEDPEVAKRKEELEAHEKRHQSKYSKDAIDEDMRNAFAKHWIVNNDWYDPMGKDADSRTVLAIDEALTNQDYDSTDKSYWEELDRRVRMNLPHRFANYDQKLEEQKELEELKKLDWRNGYRERENRPVSSLSPGYISKERKEALIAAGVWDDPTLRKRFIKSYEKWDKENGV